MRILFFLAFTIFTFEFAQAQLPSYLPTNGLVGWWPFNGNANDESGNGNNGTVNGATLTTDRFGNVGKAFSFDGVNDFIEVPVKQYSITNYTISCWFKFPINPIVGDYKAMVQASGGLQGPPGYSLSLQISANPTFAAFNKVSVSINGAGVFNGWISNSTFNDNMWHHLVGVLSSSAGLQTNSSHIQMYIDGLLINSNSTSVDFSSVTSPVNGNGYTRFGMMEHLINGRYFQGELDDIAIYNRALTQLEITALYRNCSSSDSSSFSASGCNSYTLPWGDSVTTSGAYAHTYTNASGCDSIVTANIIIHHPEVGASINISGVGPYTLPWGETVSNSGYYSHVYQNQYGCDSLVTAYVSVEFPSDSTRNNVGVNVMNPQRNLHVNDVMRLEPRNTAPSNPTKGDLYFDGTLNKMRYYNGESWVDF